MTTSTDINEPRFKLPFSLGWRRELVFRSMPKLISKKNKRKGDVYYYSPQQKKFRSTIEIENELKNVSENVLTVDNFIFRPVPIGITDESKELIRNANNKRTSKMKGLTEARCTKLETVNYEIENVDSKNTSNEAPAPCTSRDQIKEYKGLLNRRNKLCSQNSVLMTLFFTPEFRNSIYKCDVDLSSNLTIVKIIKLFLELQHPSIENVEWKTNSIIEDSDEFFYHIFEVLQEDLKSIRCFNFINDIFQMKTCISKKCIECKKTLTSNLDTNNLTFKLPIYDSRRIYTTLIDALEGFTKMEDDGDKQNCKFCKKKCRAEQVVKFHKMPYIFRIALQRLKNDKQTSTTTRLSNEIQFPLELCMERFKCNDSCLKRKVNERNSKNEAHIYHLYAIILHKGNEYSGHYYSYIKNLKNNLWIKISDNLVFETPMDHILNITNGVKIKVKPINKEVPSILLYRRTDREKNEHFLNYKEFPPDVMEFYNLLKKEKEETAGKKNKRKRKS